MSKALTKAQADLNALKAEIEAWLATQPPEAVAAARAAALRPATPKPARKPAVKRTRTQLLEAATAAPVVLPAAPAEDVDTTWLDLLSPAPVAAPVAVVEPAPVAVPAPLYADATEYVCIDLVPEYVPRRTAPPREPTARRTIRKAFLDGYRG